MPLFWGPEKLAWLKGSYILTQIEERRNAIKTDYEAICRVYPPFSEISTLEEFEWARMCVCSRNFGLVINGRRTSALVPYADMLNHYRPRETKWSYDESRGAFTITALKNIASGNQVYDSYGLKCNHRFLLNYGFAVEDNIEADGCPNEVPLEIALDSNDSLRERKLPLWLGDSEGRMNEVFGPAGGKLIRVSAATVSDGLRTALALLRLVVATEKEMTTVESAGWLVYQRASDLRFALSVESEREVLKRLKTLAESQLQQYPTTLEEDERELKEGNLPPFSDHRHAVIQVRGEKQVLKYLIDLADTGLTCLNSDFTRDLTSLCRYKHPHIVDYCVNTVGQIKTQERAKGWSSRIITPGPLLI